MTSPADAAAAEAAPVDESVDEPERPQQGSAWLSEKLAFLREVAERVTLRRGGLLGRPDAAPRRVEGRTPTVLALHGYCGVPREVEVVVEAAKSLGLAAHAPLLAGHGTSPAELAPLRFADWVASVRGALAEAEARGPVVLAGLSLGSLIALELTLERPESVVGLVLLGNALWLSRPFPSWALRAVDGLGLPDFGLPKFGTDLGTEEARRDHTTYPSQPVRAAIDLQKAADRLLGELPRISCPTLLLHGALDRTCPVSNAWRVAERLGTHDVSVRIFPRSRHVLTRDVEREDVRRALESFLARWA